MAQQDSGGLHQRYYVPHESKYPIWIALGLILFMFGAGSWLNAMSSGETRGVVLFVFGFGVVAVTLYRWFATVIHENMTGLNSPQVKRSYVWGMGWFIFSEVMFFAAFFGALFYVRFLVVPWLGGEGAKGLSGQYLWPEFSSEWPVTRNPSEGIAGPRESMAAPGTFGSWMQYLPFWNTAILLSSSFTIHIAHTALKAAERARLIRWLAITVALGVVFLILQVEEYVAAYRELGLTLDSGIYGSTFFLLTGFHGFHVTLGAVMLIVMLLRVLKGHFTPEDHFGFEAASWYWHFVDVVWMALFLFVYVF